MRTGHILTSILFSTLIGVPLCLQILGIDLAMNKGQAIPPELTFKRTQEATTANATIHYFYYDVIAYKDKYNQHYQDHFILKAHLFHLYQSLIGGLLDEDPIPHKVVNGEEGWLFLGDSYSDVILESKGLRTFTEEELETLKQNLLRRNAWLNQQNCTYYVAIAPNKHSIYGKYLPIKKSAKDTKLTQLKNKMSTTEVKFMDLSTEFEQHRDTRLFDKTGTHWNDLGAFWGYKTLIQNIRNDFPELVSLPLAQFNLDTIISTQEELTKMLNVNWTEEKLILTNKNPKAKKTPSVHQIPYRFNGHPENYEFRYKSNVNNLKVLVFRDSFSTGLIQFLKENFGEIVFIWYQDIDRDLIELENPDIVIHQVVERNIDLLLIE